MSQQTQTVTAKLRIVTDDTGTKAAKSLAGALGEAIKAEKELAAATKKRADEQKRAASEGQAHTPGSAPAGPRSYKQDALRSLLEADFRRVQAERGRTQSKAKLRGDSDFSKRAADAVEKRAADARFEKYMAERGMTAAGNRLPIQRGRVGRGLDALGSRMGLPAGMGGRLGPYALLAAPAVAGKMANDLFVQSQQINATPFLSTGAAQEQKRRNLPLGIGRLYGYYEDTRKAFAGEYDAQRASEEYRVMEGSKARLTGQAELQRDRYRVDLGAAQNRAAALGDVRLDRRSTTDDTTVKGQQAYDRESRLLPLRRQITVATRERAAAEKSVADAMEEQKAREAELQEAKVDYDKRAVARQKASKSEGYNQSTYDARSADEAVAKEKLDQAQSRANQARGITDQRRGQLASAQGNERRAGIELTRGQLADTNERLAESRSGARDLASRGPGGRQEAKVALEAVLRFGANGVSPEMLDLAESVAPETVGKIKEQSGESAKEEFRKIAPNEKRFQASEPIRQERDRLEEKATQGEESDISKSAQGAVAAMQEAAKTIVDAFNGIANTLNQLRADMQRAAGNRSGH